jgi:hypothetical protein
MAPSAGSAPGRRCGRAAPGVAPGRRARSARRSARGARDSRAPSCTPPMCSSPGTPIGTGSPRAVEQVDAGVGDRPADRHQPARGRRRPRGAPGGDVDRRFGRAVEVVQRRRDSARGALLQLGGSASPLAITRRRPAPAPAPARRRRVGRKEGAQHRRHEVQGGDRLARRSVRAGRRCRGGRRGAPSPGARRRQRPEQLPHRDVEAERRLLQHPVVRRQAVALLHPEQAVDDAAVGVHRPLRAPGRARGVDHVGQVVRVHRRRRAAAAPWRPRRRRARAARAGAGRRRRGPPRPGARPARPAAQAPRQRRRPARRRRRRAACSAAARRVVGIERQIGAARLEDGDRARPPARASARRRSPPPSPARRRAAQPARQPVGRASSAAKVRLPAPAPPPRRAGGDHHRHRLGRAPRLLLDQLVQAEVGAARRRTGVVPLAQLLALGGAEPGQRLDPRRRRPRSPRGGDAASSVQELRRSRALDGRASNRSRLYSKRPGAGRPRPRPRASVRSNLAVPVDLDAPGRLQPPAGGGRAGEPARRRSAAPASPGRAASRRGRAAAPAPRPAFERQLLVGVGGEADLPHPRQQLAEGRPPGERRRAAPGC